MLSGVDFREALRDVPQMRALFTEKTSKDTEDRAVRLIPFLCRRKPGEAKKALAFGTRPRLAYLSPWQTRVRLAGCLDDWVAGWSRVDNV